MVIAESFSPYWGKNFFTFFITLFQRVLSFMSGGLSFQDLASDEVQLILLILLSLSSALIGSFITLRKMTMLANSLSHTILVGIAVYFLFFMKTADAAIPLSGFFIAAMCSAFLTTFATEGLIKVFRLQKDASIGLVFTGLFSLGVLCIALFSRNTHIGSDLIMGNIDALHLDDIFSLFWVAMLNLLFVVLFYKGFFTTSFDETLSRSLGISPVFYHYVLMFLLSITAISSFRAVGIILFLIFLVGPFLIARLYTHKMKRLLVISVLIGIFASLLGVAISRHLLSVYHTPCSTSAIVSLLISAGYIFALFQKILRNYLSRQMVINEKNISFRK